MKRINIKFIEKFKKRKLLKFGWMLGLGIVPVVASSCAVSATLIKNSYIVTGNSFTSNLSLSDIATNSLKSTTGMTSYLKSVTDRVIYNWLVQLGNKNSDYKTLLDNKKSSINTDYNDSVKNYKKKYGVNWQVKFQQEVLDPVGGTKQDYINNQLYSFARTTLTDKLFSTLYLTIYDEKNNQINLFPSADDILSALKNTTSTSGATNTSLKFKFDNTSDLTSDKDDEPDSSFASFQDYIFQKYVEYENPYIVDNVQWNYSTPSGSDGINSIYKIPTSVGSSSGGSDSSGSGSSDSSNSGSTKSSSNTQSYNISYQDSSSSDSSSSNSSGDSSGSDSSSTSSNAGSYAFPYFGNENATNTSPGTVSKFISFVSGTNNYIDSSDTTIGLKNIDLTKTDGTSTLTLVKNSSLFSDQSAEYAAATSYMYGILGSSSTSAIQVQDIKSKITHNIDLSTSSVFDNITSNFVSSSSSLYENSSTSGTTSPTISTLKLDKSYVSKNINSSGPLSSVSDKELYVIDNFIPGTIKTSASGTASTTLDKFMFFRSSKGVEAVSIDGNTLISTATTIKDKKTKAANIVLYRYFMGEQGYSKFTIDLKSEISTFFTSNIDWLIYQYVNENSHTGIDGNSMAQNMFNLDGISSTDKDLAKVISYFIPASSFYNNTYTAAQKMYEAKKTYNQNYGYSVYSNGLASNFNYAYGSSSDAQNNYVNPNMFYENALLASTANSPYSSTSTSKNANNSVSSSLYNDVLNKISNVVNGISKQDADYNKYSQYLYSNNYFVNNAMISVLSDTNYVSGMAQNPILSKYIDSFYNVSSKSFSISTSPFTTANSSDSTSASEIQTYLQNAMYNFFFLSNFTSETDSMFSFGATSNTKSTTTIDSTNNASKALESIRNYSWDLWNDTNTKDLTTQTTNYNTLYKLVSSIKYLMGTDLSNFLQYMKYHIGSDKAFVVWQNSENENVSALKTNGSTTYSTPSSSSLVTQSNLSINTNNSIYGNYVGQKPYSTSSSATINAYNLDSSASYLSSVNTNYFSATSNSLTTTSSSNSSVNVGFMGLQLSTSSNLPSDVSNALFTKPYDYNIGIQGVLYQYESKDGLKSAISNTTTLTNLTTLATNLDTLTNYEYNFTGIVNSTKSLDDKKTDMKNTVDSMSDSDNLFKQFKGYVGNSTTSNSTTTINSYSSDSTSVSKYGTYAIELKASDFDSLSSLQTALGATSGNADSYKTADEIICNLIVQYASDTTNQYTWMSNIVSDSKIRVYDIRAYNAFASDGMTWVKNYKTISS